MELEKGEVMNARDLSYIEVLMRQADFHIALFDKRREYSWKVTLAYWGAILGAATLLRDIEFETCGVVIAGVIVILLLAT